MRIPLGVGALALALGAGCSLDTSGLGHEVVDPVGTTGADTEPGESSMGSVGSSEHDTTDGGSGESSSSGEPACDDPMTWYPDDDGDGHGDPRRPVHACEQPDGHVADADDCNDQAETAYPGAEEICDAIDNDCDGEIDEWAQGTNDGECNGCVPLKLGSVLYMACAGDMSWSEGLALCQARGAELTSITSVAENDAIVMLLNTAGGYTHAFIGYNDLQTEGVWVWSDGTPSGYTNWAELQPAAPGLGGHTQDCATIRRASGEWDDRGCDNSASESNGVVCRDLLD